MRRQPCLCCSASPRGLGNKNIGFWSFSQKMSRNGRTPTRVVRFLEDFVVVVFIKHSIAEKVFDFIFATHMTEPIPPAIATFMAKQDLYNLFIIFAKWSFGNCNIHLVPAKSGSLPELYGKILLLDFFTKFWRKFFMALESWQLFDTLTIFSTDITGWRFFLNGELMSLFTFILVKEY